MLELFTCLRRFIRKFWIMAAPVLTKYVFPAIDIAFVVRVAITEQIGIYDAIVKVFGNDVDVEEKIRLLANSIRNSGLDWKCTQIEDDLECVASFLKTIRLQRPIVANAVYKEIAKTVLRSTYDKPLKDSQADTIVQIAFTFKKENLSA